MYPEIFGIPFLHTYGVLLAIGFLAALAIAAKLGKRERLDPEAVTNLGMACAISAIVGAKLMMFVVDWKYYQEHPSEIFSVSTLQAGGVFYGGLIGALLVSWWYMRRKRLPGWKTADVFAPGIALGHAIGRIGCFTAGCCWGIECHRSWAVTFNNPQAHDQGTPLGIPLHPTQLYESAAEFIIFGILYYRIHRPHADGAIISLYLMLYSIARFIVEFFRYHEQGNLWGGPLDTSQWISIALFLAGAAYFVLRSGRKPAHA